MQQQGDLRIAQAGGEIRRKIQEILPLVTKPNQYLGDELNVCLKNHSEVDLRVALAYPDTYYIGMSHLGLKIIYHILNRRDDVVAERAYAPWVDMESQLRKRGIPLFSLESHTPLREFDLLGFTLQHELNFTNLLNMLDLAQIPLRSRKRDQSLPLVMAGGSCASNPEPLAEFVDAFVIGDGEEVVEEVADVLIKGKRERWDRRQTLLQLAGLEGIYVPSLYQAEYDKEGRFQKLIPIDQTALPTIRARVVERLDLKNYTLQPLVPLIEIAHDRLSIEIMRGCTRGCRYCQAGMIYRPLREKSPGELLQEVAAGISNTGWDEISLVSLSSSDYSCLLPVVAEINRVMAQKRVALSLPSMRPDTFSEELARAIRDVRRTGLTFAPEAGTQRLRQVINKDFQEEALLETMRIAFGNGWESVKLYFMIGLPTETWDDLQGIVELGRKVQRLFGKRGKKDINLSISPFTPKAHTPFQWERQDSVEVLAKKSQFLKSHLPHRGMHVKWRDPHVSFLEGVFARGDRRLSEVLIQAWKMGCTFDSWSEQFRFSHWAEAFSKTNIDAQRYTDKWALDGPLPWEHIDYGPRRQFLIDERHRALKGQLTEDCRSGRCHGCGVHQSGQERKPVSQPATILKVKPKPSFGRKRKYRTRQRPQVARTRMRIHYSKENPLQYISHLDLTRLFERAIRRADLPMAYSQGFHPHPKIAFGPPLPLGFTGSAEYLDIQFAKPLAGDLAYRLGSKLPPGISIRSTKVIFGKTESLTAAINVAEYKADLREIGTSDNLQERLTDLLAGEHLAVQRVTPKGSKTVDIQSHLMDLHLGSCGEEEFLYMRLKVGEGGHARPREVLEAILNLSHEELLRIPIERTGLFIERDGRMRSPMDDI